MNKILYEASYVGSSKGFFNIVMVIIMLTLVCLSLVYKIRKLKKEHSENEEKGNFIYKGECALDYIGLTVFGTAGLIIIVIAIVVYGKVILGYKWRGEYREVEGVVEEYKDKPNFITFTINGVKFNISGHNLTWGYTYWQGENVITGDGQHLKIRYIPPNAIVYIEEIADE